MKLLGGKPMLGGAPSLVLQMQHHAPEGVGKEPPAAQALPGPVGELWEGQHQPWLPPSVWG